MSVTAWEGSACVGGGSTGRWVPYLEGKGLVFLELDEQDGLLVVDGHEFALGVSSREVSFAAWTEHDGRHTVARC